MKLMFAAVIGVLVACAPTRRASPGEPADERLVVTYYYLNF